VGAGIHAVCGQICQRNAIRGHGMFVADRKPRALEIVKRCVLRPALADQNCIEARGKIVGTGGHQRFNAAADPVCRRISGR